MVRVPWIAILLATISMCARAEPPFQRQADGSYTVTANGYAAKVDPSGLLSSLTVGDNQYLREPIRYGDKNPPDLPVIVYTATFQTLQPNELVAELSPPDGPNAGRVVVDLLYTADNDDFHITIKKLVPGFSSIAWHMSDDVLGVESIKRPGFGFTRLPGTGLIRALPVVDRPGGLRDVRWFFKNGRALDLYYKLHDVNLNRDANGQMYQDLWGRGGITQGGPKDTPLDLIFQIPRPGPGPGGGPSNATPPVREEAASGRIGPPIAITPAISGTMFAAGQPAQFVLNFSPKVPAPKTALTLAWRLVNFFGDDAGSGTMTVDPSKIVANKFPFDVKAPPHGYNQLIVSLTPAGVTALPSQNALDFGVYTPKDDLTSPPVPLTPPALTAELGLKCYRQADGLILAREMPTREQSPVGNPNFDWSKMDAVIQGMARDRDQYHLNCFCLLNLRPNWADPDTFQELIRLIVDRYKALNHVWEIENEPIGRYTPATYVQQALKPAYLGAHAADPNAVILGPSYVRVNPTAFQQFFAAGGGQFVDAISTHTYVGHSRSWEEHGNLEDLRLLRRMMDQNGLSGKPIWQTEQGYTWDDDSDQPKLAAAYIARMLALAADAGIPLDRFDYFYTENHGFQPYFLFDKGPNRGGMAARVYSEQTDGLKFDHELDLGKYGQGIVFSNGTDDVAELWTDDFEADAQLMTDTGAGVTAVDIMGNPVEVRHSGPQMTVALSGYPIYVHVPHGANIAALTRFGSGKNWALASNGGAPSASSEGGRGEDASGLNDGTWHYDDGQTDQRIWASAPSLPMPQWAQVTFDQPRRIGTIVAVTPSSHHGKPGARDYRIEALVNGQWKTVKAETNNTIHWVLFARFAPVTATAVRIVFNDLNNGWWRDDKTTFSDMRARVYELEAYGG